MKIGVLNNNSRFSMEEMGVVVVVGGGGLWLLEGLMGY